MFIFVKNPTYPAYIQILSPNLNHVLQIQTNILFTFYIPHNRICWCLVNLANPALIYNENSIVHRFRNSLHLRKYVEKKCLKNSSASPQQIILS